LQARRKVKHMIATLLVHFDARDKFSTALTIFDALESKKAEGLCRQPGLRTSASPACVAAIVRLALKCDGTDATFSLLDYTFANVLAAAGEEVAAPESVTRMETCIVHAFNGQVWLQSPADWAGLVMARLEARAAISFLGGAAAPLPEGATLGVLQLAHALAAKVPATADLPPRTQGLTACAFGLIRAGVLPADELQPHGLPLTEWFGSFLAHAGVSGDSTARPQLQAQVVAEAAGCEEHEFCELVFAGAAALQAYAFEEDALDRQIP